ncbi:MAG: iron ABC transporter permease [Bacteroidota bacterium]
MGKVKINNNQSSHLIKFVIIGLLLILLFFADIIFGSVILTFNDILNYLFDHSAVSQNVITIIEEFRFPKSIAAICVGIALSISGMQMQTVFRNPLAGPYVLGISSGASLGVAIVIMGMTSFFSFELFQMFREWTLIIAAFLGSGLVLLIIMIISHKIRDIMTILIIGIMIGAVTSAIISVIQYSSDSDLLKSYVLWSLGSLGSITKKELMFMVPAIFSGLFITLLYLKKLNALLMGELYAESLGVNIRRTRLMIFLSTSILAGTVTAFCGPIAFIGIAIPHIARIMFKTSNHSVLFFACILLGAVSMLFSDLIAHVPGSYKILPINAITSLLGIPVVIWIVIKNQKISNLS